MWFAHTQSCRRRGCAPNSVARPDSVAHCGNPYPQGADWRQPFSRHVCAPLSSVYQLWSRRPPASIPRCLSQTLPAMRRLRRLSKSQIDCLLVSRSVDFLFPLVSYTSSSCCSARDLILYQVYRARRLVLHQIYSAHQLVLHLCDSARKHVLDQFCASSVVSLFIGSAGSANDSDNDTLSVPGGTLCEEEGGEEGRGGTQKKLATCGHTEAGAVWTVLKTNIAVRH